MQVRDPVDVMRWYDGQKAVFVFQGDSFDILAVAYAVVAILPVAKKALESALQACGRASPSGAGS